MQMKVVLDEGAFMPERAHPTDAGLDIGLTLIGMHLRRVAIPLRLNNRQIGNAIVAAARTRPMLIGGERAAYTDDK